MKHLMVALLLTGGIAACNNGNDTSTIKAEDTLGLAAYKQAQQQAYIDSLARVKADSLAAADAKAKKTTAYTNSQKTESVTTSSSYPANSEKKGWSKAAKGAVIGGATGAAAGAVIHKKNRVVGGVVGAAAGAGVGYGIGKRKDKKDGRN